MSNPTVGQFRAIWQGILDRLSGQAGKAQVQDVDVKDAIDALRQVDFSTEAGQDAIKAALDLVKLNTDSIKNKDFSTSAKQDLIVDVLDALKIDTTAIKGKDFATDTTLTQVKSELEAVKAELQAVKANQTSGDQKVQLSGTLTELFGKDLSARPSASSVGVGTTFMIVGDTKVYQSDGTDWVVISE
jgi:hypothetical protein